MGPSEDINSMVNSANRNQVNDIGSNVLANEAIINVNVFRVQIKSVIVGNM